MINILISNTNLFYSKILINFLIKNLNNIQIKGLANNVSETYELLSIEQNKIDVIIIDLYILNDKNFKILKYIKKQNCHHIKLLIILSNNDDILISKENFFDIPTIIIKADSLNNILIPLKKLSLESLEYIILKELKYLKYNTNHIGTQYILESILLIATSSFVYIDNLSKNIYPIIALKHNTTIHNIKCNITNATSIMNCDCEKSIIKKYFNFYDEFTEAKPKQVISQILINLKKKNII